MTFEFFFFFFFFYTAEFKAGFVRFLERLLDNCQKMKCVFLRYETVHLDVGIMPLKASIEINRKIVLIWRFATLRITDIKTS